ncbi:3-keto-disaccharide hydrolase [Stratiformator vulcanicus]|uniref:3-keto-alpha-glucoside-1,2-lyase/3-keto-2-hydroxy-glucal hydratase domain-containing protein n=1 Tax=Stratiformator vulcanicus TaxID=2527980 RepID=A0A517QWW4_9PLAN|nr:DUF1080 domain-containing protein [Stratiformator vulcanicus]QDT36073.1 hypothetical protein Pan189_04280 [Stratiformator vulcanicus]
MLRLICVIVAVVVGISVGTSHVKAEPIDGGWIQLFDGKTLKGWTPKFRGEPVGENYLNTFRVEDGLLTVSYDQYETWNEKFGHLFYKEPAGRYRLRFEYRFLGDQVGGGPNWARRNNGIMIHGQEPAAMKLDQKFPNSLEVQLLGGLNEKSKRPTLNLCTPGTFVRLNDKDHKQHCTNSNSRTFNGDQWVTGEIIVDGDRSIQHLVDGEVVMEYSQPRLDDGTPLASGTISIQAESAPIQFRRIELKHLGERE